MKIFIGIILVLFLVSCAGFDLEGAKYEKGKSISVDKLKVEKKNEK